ncbi:TPA: hypothetical protein ACXJAC_002659 [Serratia marcescens]
MNTDKLSELSKPASWSDERGNLCTNTIKERGMDSKYRQDYEKYSTPLYSQEYVSALKHESAVNWEAAASLNVENQELKKRIAELEEDRRQLNLIINSEANRADAAEKRLATPVRLVAYRNSPDMHTKQYYEAIGFNQGIDACSVAVRAAGFTVQGDE